MTLSEALLEDVKRMRVGLLLRRASRAVGRAVWPVIAVLTYPLVVLLRPLLLIRVSPIPAKRLGHFAARPGFYLAERQLGMHPEGSLDIFFLRPSKPVNQPLFEVFKRSLRFWQPAQHFYKIYKKMPGGAVHLGHPIGQKHGDLDADGVLARTEPGVSLTDEEMERGWRILEEQGIPRGSQLICFHARSERYVRHIYRDRDRETVNSYKNSDIEDFLPALELMAEKGYYAFRMSAVPEQPLPPRHPNIRDYANEFRSEFMDLFLLANCRFMIANGSGPDAICELFRRPVVFVSYAVLAGVHSWMPNVTIFKRYWIKDEQRVMTFPEAFEKDCHYILDTAVYAERGIELIPNTPEEIVAAVTEMEARIEGSWVESEANEKRQARFREIIAQHWLHGHPCNHIGAAFLEENAYLLE